MARQTHRPRPRTVEYYVYDPAATELGGISVVERDGKKRIVLQPVQAQFFLDQGLIGTEALDKRSDAARRVTDQLLKKSVDQQHRGGAAQVAPPAPVRRPTPAPAKE